MIHWSRAARAAAVVLISAAFFAAQGCALQSPPAPSGAAAPTAGAKAAAKTPVKVRLASTSAAAEGLYPAFIARSKGFFAEEGIEVEFTYTSEQIAALVGGSVDIIHDAGDQGLAARKRGVDIVAIHSAVTKPTQYLVALPEFKTFAQLKGQQLAVSDINSTDYLVLAALLKANNVGENEVTFRKVGFSSARLAAVEQKQVAATLLTASTWLDGRRKVQGLNLMATPKDLVEFPWDTMQVNRKWAQEHEALVVGYLRAFIKGTRWLVDPANTAEAVTILQPETKLSGEDVKDLLSVLLADQIYQLDRPIVAAPFERYVDALIQAKALEPPVDIAGFIDTSFFEKARTT